MTTGKSIKAMALTSGSRRVSLSCMRRGQLWAMPSRRPPHQHNTARPPGPPARLKRPGVSCCCQQTIMDQALRRLSKLGGNKPMWSFWPSLTNWFNVSVKTWWGPVPICACGYRNRLNHRNCQITYINLKDRCRHEFMNWFLILNTLAAILL